jgi:hypothetical protein
MRHVATPVPVPGKVLVLGDNHANLATFTAAAKAAVVHGCEVIVSVGDFGYFPRLDFGAVFLEGVYAVLAELGVTCIVVDGNHEDHVSLAAAERTEAGFAILGPGLFYAPRGLHWNWHGVEFLAAGGAVSTDAALLSEGYDWFAEEVISFADANCCIDGGAADVVLCHDWPAELEVEGVALDSVGAPTRHALSAIVEATGAAQVFCGHHHVRASEKVTIGTTVVTIDALGFDRKPEDQAVVFDLATLGVTPA